MTDFATLCTLYRSELLDRTVPFWLRHGLDWKHGGICTCLADDGMLLRSDKYVWSQLRAIWTFDWDDQGKGVKNDRLDALALCQRLDRNVRGNKKAFSIVRVPTEEEERERAMNRQRQQLVRERQRLTAMGRSLLAMRNIHVTGRW